jgi:2-haloacid dehalogenase
MNREDADVAKPFTETPKTAIVFDFGGVLMDWDPYYLFGKMLGNDRTAMDQFLKEINFSTWNVELDRGLSFAEGTKELISHFPQYQELIRAYDVRYLETVKGAFQPVVDILQKLKEAGYPLYGLSNWSAEKFTLVRASHPFFEWFDEIVLSGEIGLVKPDKAMFDFLLQRIGLPASECLFIDDYPPNINAARDLGFQTIHYQSPQQLQSELNKRGIDF